MKCPICGMVRNDQTLTCSRCGHDHTTEIQQIFCPDCGTPMPSRAKVCLMCGERIDGPIQVRRWPRWPRIPLPHLVWLPIPLPESLRLSVLLLIIIGAGVIVLLLQWTQPFASKAAKPSVAALLVSPTATATPTATETLTPTPTSSPTLTHTPTPTPTPIYHVVESGENPGSIATKYGLTIDQLTSANKIKDPRALREGQSLLSPSTALPPGKAVPADAQLSATPIVYKVQAGDTLGSIAIWAGSTVDDIMKANSLKNASWLSVGQTLLIPISAERQKARGTPTPESEGIEAVYIIQPGDSLLSIAQEYHTSLDVIMKANHIEDQGLIRAGESLLVPLPAVPPPSPTSLSTSTPTPGPRYAAPAPLIPPDQQYFWSDTEPVLLNWIAVGILGADDWYVVELKYRCNGQDEVRYGWTRSNGWRVPTDVCQVEAQSHQPFRWNVQIFHSPDIDISPRGLKPLSPPGAQRTFYRH